MKTTQNLYLKTMYMLEIKTGKIRVTDVATNLGYTKSSVSKALKRLDAANLISYETYGNIILSKEAYKIAEELIMKEDLLELFFVGILNIPESKAKEDVKIISEYVSNETKDGLKKYIKKTFKIDEECNCKHADKNACETCETNKIKKIIGSNPKWVKVLKEKK